MISNVQFAKFAIVSAVVAQLLLISLIFLRPDLPVYSSTISEWEIGKYGWLMRVAFIISAISYLFFFYTVKKETDGKSGKIGLLLIFLSFIGTLGVGVFVTDPFPPDFSLPATVLHTIGGTLRMVLFPVGMLLVTFDIAKTNPLWKNYTPVIRVLGVVPLLAFIAFVVQLSLFVMPSSEDATGENLPIGYPPRIMFFIFDLAIMGIAFLFIRKEHIKIK